MALHTSTLVLYKNSALEIDRNFMVDSLADYLATLSKDTISSFQYIKHGLAINIKIDKTQATLDYISDNNYNYCSIQNDDGRLVYYYIVGKQWRGQSTIELNLQMDTINTFALGVDYSLSKQSLVSREHKDRWKLKTHLIHIFKAVNQGYYIGGEDTYTTTITIPNAQSINGAEIRYYRIHNEDGETLPINPTIYNTTISNSSITIDIDFHGTFTEPYYLDIEISVDYNQYVRIIDKMSEGINPQLFKKDIGQLYDGDMSENWYLIYKNANAVVSNPSDTEATYVNPVKILLCRDSSLHVNPTSLSSVRIDCINIPRIPDKRENVIFCYDDLTAEQKANPSTFIIGGTTYTLVADEDVDFANHKVWGIVWTRINNNDVVGDVRFYRNPKNHYFYSYLGIVNNISYIDVYNYTQARYNSLSGAYTSFAVSDLFSKTTGVWYIGSGASSIDSYTKTIKDVDLTDETLIKIIALPYCPIKELVGVNDLYAIPTNLIWNAGYEMLEIKTTNMYNFVYEKEMDMNPASKLIDVLYSPTTAMNRNKLYESKIYNSEFYYQKFVYGGYSFQFNLEAYDIDNDNIWNYTIKYAVSQSVQSKMLFQFTSYITDEYDTQDYNDVLLVGMNNEIAIYNNSYINYLRTGYQYELQERNRNIMMKGLGVGLSAIGTLASFVSAPLTGGLSIATGIGMATSTFGNIAGLINSTNQSEKQIEHKKQALARQSENVSQVEDVDLLEAYTENKPKMVEYKPSTIMQNRINDLFFYCGYATQEYKIPSFTGRKYFNYVMADIRYSSDTNLPEDIKEDIKNKYAIGITCLHKVGSTWDFAQQYENYETSLE